MTLLEDLVIQDLGQPKKEHKGQKMFLCPFHDDTDPSLSVGGEVYNCFGCHASGNHITWLKEYRKMDGKQIAEFMKGRPESKDYKKQDQPKKKVYAFNKFPDHTALYKYCDRRGRVIGWVWRLDKTKDDKDIKQYCHRSFYKGEVTGNGAIIAAGMPRPHVLYRYNEIVDAKLIIVVEGEKTCDALWTINLGIAATTWCGGTPAYTKSDWSLLRDKDVLLIADRDDPGRKAMEGIRNILVEHAKSIRMIMPKGKDGWDLADAIEDDAWTARDVKKWISNQLKEKQPESASGMPEINAGVFVDNTHFRIIGRTDDHILFKIKKTNEIKPYKWNALDTKALERLAPLTWWIQTSGIDKAHSITGSMLQTFVDGIYRAAQDNPRFDADRIKGRGVSIDGKHNVYHLGDRLLVDDDDVSLADAEDTLMNYYKEYNPIKLSDERCDDDLLCEFAKTILLYRWRTEFEGAHFIGWLVASLIGGGLDWRAHIWLLAPATTGKSWLIREVIKKVHGECTRVGGDTTPPALARILGSESLPFIADEAEPKKGGLIYNVMDLLRLSSDGIASRFRASTTSDSDVLTSTPRASVMMSSINIPNMSAADRTRYVFVRLSGRGVDDWGKVSQRILSVCKHGVAIRTHIIRQRMAIFDYIAKTKYELAPYISNTRLLDNTAQLLGSFGWLIGTQDGGLIRRFKKPLEALEGRSQTDSYEGILEEILAIKTRIGSKTYSLATLLFETKRETHTQDIPDYSPSRKERDLAAAECGVKWDSGAIHIACKHPELIKSLKGTQIEGVDLSNALLSLAGVTPVKGNIRFGHLRFRNVVKIPIEVWKDVGVT